MEKKKILQLLQKAQVPGIQSKTNNIKIDCENYVCHIKKEQNTTLSFFQ